MTDKINLDELIDAAESFHGTELDETKMARLNHMRDLCRAVSDAEPHIRNPFEPFDNTCRHASVTLETRNPLWTFDARVAKLLSELLSMTDDLSVCIVDGTDTIRAMFSVRDMWTKYDTGKEK